MRHIPKLAFSALLALTMAGTLSVLAPASALAAASSSAIVNTDGTRAGESFFNRGAASHGGRAWFDVYDAKCEGHSVYVEYILNGGPPTQKKNDNGCGTTKGFNLQSGYFAIQYRTCVDDSFGNHPCSVWKSDHN